MSQRVDLVLAATTLERSTKCREMFGTGREILGMKSRITGGGMVHTVFCGSDST